ncbi:MAG: DNA topoisomerase IV subunit B [Sphingomonadaceae bacterium]|uniref:DNA topoisomerase IV subunit B n=1 Tax=Thermaurantiacus sp. TaxID=2820283 RepID=UPI00298F30EE|nr:DNA topoisomerase IV subunit B [Thermaurantiacus sp.]MCS6986383.1 DNA topoisomerase IV subunit B [Sphingomonadaceae bacterium]MDW8414355.1 DNA topoisomerase IV subunit B [Thermaurantiacus sp.]
MADLFATGPVGSRYDASDIEVLEGLEPVRRRPGMYVGGIDARALHHLAAEVLDNAMDEAVAGHATRIEVELLGDGAVRIADNGRGIPVDPHPKFPDRSALEVILTTLHSGGKFSGRAYRTAGGLHGVGLSVVNALSERLVVEVARQRTLYRLTCVRGVPTGPLDILGPAPARRGTTVIFRPDPQIFGPEARFEPERLWRLARSKAYLFGGVEIRWRCPAELARDPVPAEQVFLFPRGLADHLAEAVAGEPTVTDKPFTGRAAFPPAADGRPAGQVEWAVHWTVAGEAQASWYCNTIPNPGGGTHEAGFRAAVVKALRAFGQRLGQKRAAELTADDALAGAVVMLSLFLPEPQFQAQTKDRLTSPEATRLVEGVVRDLLDHWLAEDQERGRALLTHVLARMEERLARRQARDVVRRQATSRRGLRLPGKLADCVRQEASGTELFIVEGDSAGGSAKQARDRHHQAVLPIRGKILNVAAAAQQKVASSQELADLALALGCGTRDRYRPEALRYERVVIMTDADVDGAHIATLLMTFFFREMPDLVRDGRLYLALPPLFRLAAGAEVAYARDEAERDALLAGRFRGRKVEISRFKGLGEMTPAQLRATTMDPATRTLLRVTLPPTPHETRSVGELVDRLMGRQPEHRFAFIQARAAQVAAEAIDA